MLLYPRKTAILESTRLSNQGYLTKYLGEHVLVTIEKHTRVLYCGKLVNLALCQLGPCKLGPIILEIQADIKSLFVGGF